MSVQVTKKDMKNTFNIYWCRDNELHITLSYFKTYFFAYNQYGNACNYYILEDDLFFKELGFSYRVVICTGREPSGDVELPTAWCERMEKYSRKLINELEEENDLYRYNVNTLRQKQVKIKLKIKKHLMKEIFKLCTH